jgi:RNA 3'-terminal phosphate cyclase
MASIRDKGWSSFFSKFMSQSTMEVTVGLHEDDGERDEATVENAEVGYYNEFGGRPFVRPAFDGNKQEYLALIKRLYARSARGRSAIDLVGELVGEKAVDDIVAMIEDNSYPVSDKTQARKDKKGQGAQALVATGQMRDAVDYKVKK